MGFYKLIIIKIIYFHCFFYIIKSFCRFVSCTNTTVSEYFINIWNILFQLFSFILNRFKFFKKNIKQKFLYLYISKTTTLVMSLQFIKVSIVRQIPSKMLFITECIQICKYCIPLNLTRITYLNMYTYS